MIKNIFEKFAQEKAISYQIGLASDGETGLASFLINTRYASFKSVGYFIESESVFMVLVDVGLRVDEDKMDEVLRCINEVNATCKIGYFYIDKETSTVVSRVSQLLVGTNEEKAATLTAIILTNANMASDIFPLISDLLV